MLSADLICWHLSVQRSALWPFTGGRIQVKKNIPTVREEKKGGLEKIDGQLSERERKLREREQTLQKSAVH